MPVHVREIAEADWPMDWPIVRGGRPGTGDVPL
jgi:hypothetical protein